MASLRYKDYVFRKNSLLEVAERLILENNQEITLQELALELDIAKGTIYKHFSSKNELYLELLILNEKRILEISRQYEFDLASNISEYMLYHLHNTNRTVLFHAIEERIANTDRTLQKLFKELYCIREQRIAELRVLVGTHIAKLDRDTSVRDYLSYVWTITYGASLLLSSSYYQKPIGNRDHLINFYIQQALEYGN